MARLVLVRHAEPDSSWGDHPDPGLSAVGTRQAEEAARRLAEIDDAAIVTSPLRRARETAAPLEGRVGRAASIDPRFGEIATPPGLSIPGTEWLRGVLAGPWDKAGPDARAWRSEVLEAAATTRDATIVFTHFVAINAVVGAATGDERVWVCSPAHASVTVVEIQGSAVVVTSLGDQAGARVQ